MRAGAGHRSVGLRSAPSWGCRGQFAFQHLHPWAIGGGGHAKLRGVDLQPFRDAQANGDGCPLQTEGWSQVTCTEHRDHCYSESFFLTPRTPFESAPSSLQSNWPGFWDALHSEPGCTLDQQPRGPRACSKKQSASQSSFSGTGGHSRGPGLKLSVCTS